MLTYCEMQFPIISIYARLPYIYNYPLNPSSSLRRRVAQDDDIVHTFVEYN